MSDTKNTETWSEFAEKHPEYLKHKNRKKISKSMQYMCQCENGHVFDFRERKRLPQDDKYSYAPFRGRCPECHSMRFSFIGNKVYPIKWNFIS